MQYQPGGSADVPDAALARRRVIFALQRQLVLRARRALFADLDDLGGVPTLADDAAQAALDARATRDMCEALQGVLDRAFTRGTLTPAQREYWLARAPAMLGFGARLHGELTRLAARPAADPRPAQALALFQLAATLLDWIGDEQCGGAAVARLLPIGQLPGLFGNAGRRRRLLRRARAADGPTHAFACVLVALLDLVAQLPADATSFANLLGAAYDAELESFDASAPAEHVLRARRKSELPTIVSGALARLSVRDDEAAVIESAAAAIAPMFGTLDDMADLSDDLRAGAVNTLASTSTHEDDAIEAAMRHVLAGDSVEVHAMAVAACIRHVHAVALDAGVRPAQLRAFMQWLRARAWQWLS